MKKLLIALLALTLAGCFEGEPTDQGRWVWYPKSLSKPQDIQRSCVPSDENIHASKEYFQKPVVTEDGDSWVVLLKPIVESEEKQ